MRFIILYSN